MAKQTGAMLAQVRQQAIAELVHKMGNITVNDLCTKFNVSPATIRNDLRSLESQQHHQAHPRRCHQHEQNGI